MLNRSSKNTVIHLLLLVSVVGFLMAAFIIGGNIMGFIFAAIITITEDAEQNTVFRPETTNITRGEEIFIGNNSSTPQSITSGTGPEDPLSGKLFDTGVIKSKGYGEFVTANLNPGSYPYYSSTNQSVKGTIIIQK